MWKEIVGWTVITLIVGTGIYTIYAEFSSYVNRYRTQDSLTSSSPVRSNPYSTPILMLSPTPVSRKETGKVADISTTPAPTSRSASETSPATPSQTKRDIPPGSG